MKVRDKNVYKKYDDYFRCSSDEQQRTRRFFKTCVNLEVMNEQQRTRSSFTQPKIQTKITVAVFAT